MITLVMFTLLVSFRAVLGCQSKSVFFMSNDWKSYQGSCCTVLLRFARLKVVHTAKVYILDASIQPLALTVLVMGVFEVILQNYTQLF